MRDGIEAVGWCPDDGKRTTDGRVRIVSGGVGETFVELAELSDVRRADLAALLPAADGDDATPARALPSRPAFEQRAEERGDRRSPALRGCVSTCPIHAAAAFRVGNCFRVRRPSAVTLSACHPFPRLRIVAICDASVGTIYENHSDKLQRAQID